jgi:TRAP-type C4-dicarboxylate transport system permease small subunit
VKSLEKLNGWVYQVERFIVVASLLIMSVVMFLAVLHRSYADEDSVLFGKIATTFLGAERDDETWKSMQGMADWAVPLGLVILIYLGFRTASRRPLWNRPEVKSGATKVEIHGEPLSHAKCLIYTVLTSLGGWGLMMLLFGTGSIEQSECIEIDLRGESDFACGMFPAGLQWAASFSLVLMLWVSFLGASMATRDNLHLKLEAANKALPERLRRITGLLAGILTATFCLLLAYLGYRYCGVKYDEWVMSDHLGALHDATPIPFWASFTIVPIAWVLMAIRFVGAGVLAFRGELDETLPELRELEKTSQSPATEKQGSADKEVTP